MQRRAGDPKNGPAAGGRYLLRDWAKVKIWAGRIRRSLDPDTPRFQWLRRLREVKPPLRRYARLVMLSNRKALMRAMVLAAPGAALTMQERPDPAPGDGEVRIKVSACGVCRTDLHVVDGELPDLRYPIVPGHEVVGRIDAVGTGVTDLTPGMPAG